jgi:DNA-binding NtrC family response regulator
MAEPHTRSKYRILVVDDEDLAREGLKQVLKRPDVTIDLASGSEEALELMFDKSQDYHVVLTDFLMPRMNGKELLERIVRDRPLTRVIVVTGKGTTSTAVECMKAGAYDYIEKPFDIVLIRASVDRAIRECRLSDDNLTLRKSLSLKGRGDHVLVWEDPKMDRTVLLAQKLALTEDPILIEGESGTGKELIARFIHESSRLSDRKFMAVNCGALPEDLLPSELFGYEKGAFTGANETKEGIFEATHGGTLFLDEIGDLPLSMQARFLRVLEQKEVFRVGGRNPVPVNFRLVAATNRKLDEMASVGTFRPDLFYRLRVHYLRIPPLRERPQDILMLLGHFCQSLDRTGQGQINGFSSDCQEALRRYDWPGNVRELASMVRQVAVVAGGRAVEVDDLPDHVKSRVVSPAEEAEVSEVKREATVDTLKNLKIEYIRQALEKTGGNRTQTARLLGISRVSLQRFLLRHPDLADVGRTRSW